MKERERQDPRTVIASWTWDTAGGGHPIRTTSRIGFRGSHDPGYGHREAYPQRGAVPTLRIPALAGVQIDSRHYWDVSYSYRRPDFLGFSSVMVNAAIRNIFDTYPDPITQSRPTSRTWTTSWSVDTDQAKRLALGDRFATQTPRLWRGVFFALMKRQRSATLCRIAAAVTGRTQVSYDLVIRNGTMVTEPVAPARPADIGVSGDRIVAVARWTARAPTRSMPRARPSRRAS